MDCFLLTVGLLKAGVLVIGLLQVVPIMLWVERRGSALMQNRLGPNRVGPWGILQALVDVIKFLWKEDPIPGHVKKSYYILAPLMSLIPAFMTFAVIPIAAPIEIFGRRLTFQAADLDVGFLYIFAVASLGIYGIIMAGWASNSIYALFGSLRSTCQMISYELAMSLSVIGIVLTFGSVQLADIATAQGKTFFQLGSFELQKWGVFVQPIGFIVFLTSVFAETNRLPFDLPEGEAELVAGYHLEYGAFKFAMFMMAEYLNMTTACGLVTSFYLGGWQFFPGTQMLLNTISTLFQLSANTTVILVVVAQMLTFLTKLALLMWLFVWVRWTLPRFRYDQLMDLGWKVMLPLSLVNVVVTAIFLGLK